MARYLGNHGKGTVGMPAPGRGGLPCIRPLSLFVSSLDLYVHKDTESLVTRDGINTSRDNDYIALNEQEYENMEQKYAYIFGKKAKTDDYYRFWLSLSTEKVGKNGKGTGEYLKATMPVRMSKKAAETWEEFATKTKNKDIKLGISHITDGWLKVVEGPEDPYIVMFVNDLKEQED